MLGAGEVVDGVIDMVNSIPEPTVLALRPDKINALLGTAFPPRRCRIYCAAPVRR